MTPSGKTPAQGIPRPRRAVTRWLADWDVFLVIMLLGVLTGLITFMAADANPAACRHALAPHTAARSMTWVCSRP